MCTKPNQIGLCQVTLNWVARTVDCNEPVKWFWFWSRTGATQVVRSLNHYPRSGLRIKRSSWASDSCWKNSTFQFQKCGFRPQNIRKLSKNGWKMEIPHFHAGSLVSPWTHVLFTKNQWFKRNVFFLLSWTVQSHPMTKPVFWSFCALSRSGLLEETRTDHATSNAAPTVRSDVCHPQL